MNLILLALCILPLLGCVLVSSSENHSVRRGFVWVFALLILLCGAYFGFSFIAKGCSPVSLVQEHGVIHNMSLCIFVLEVILLAYIFWRGAAAKNWTSPVLAVIQFLGLLYFEFVQKAEISEEFVCIDSLSMILIMLVSVIGPLILIFAIGYMQEHEDHLHLPKTKQPQFFGIIFFFLFAMNALAMSNNLSWICAFWEMTTLCSFLLIQHDKTDISVKNAFTTLNLNMIGGVAFTFGNILFYRYAGTLCLNKIFHLVSEYPLFLYLPIILFCIAGMTKSAQFPFQKWLLGAMVAPTPVSALLHSSTMVNAGVYLILRMAPIISGTIFGYMIAIAGGFTFMAASALAISQSNGKKVLAYSTIANLGLIVCLAGMGTEASIAGGMMLMIFHAVSKGMLFLSVGTIEQKIGSRDIEDMQGMFKIMPFTTAVLSLGMVSMLLPPFGVLVSKWIALECAVTKPLVLIFIVMGSALTVVFWAKWLGIVTTSSYKKNFPKEKVLPTTKFVLSFMVIMVVCVSIFIDFIFAFVVKPGLPKELLTAMNLEPGIRIFTYDSNLVGMFWVVPFFILMLVLVIAIPYFVFGLKPNQVRPPYTGGELANNDIRGIEFTGPGEKIENVVVRNYYLGNIFSEKILDLPLTGISILIILIMLGVFL